MREALRLLNEASGQVDGSEETEVALVGIVCLKFERPIPFRVVVLTLLAGDADREQSA